MSKLKFLQGLKSDLPSSRLVYPAYYQCTDTGELFFAVLGTGLRQVGGIGDAPSDNTSYVRKNGSWEPLGAGLSETVVLHIATDAGTLSSATVIVKNKADDSVIHTLTWTGQDLTFPVPDAVNYTVSFSVKRGFVAPATMEFTAIAGTQRNIDVTYQYIVNGVYISYDDGTVSRYNELISGKTPTGVAIRTPNISVELYPFAVTGGSWATSTGSISGVTTASTQSDALRDFAGKSNTDAVIASSKAGTAFTLIRRDLGEEWYIPACGEMEEIRLNEAIINTALDLIEGAELDFRYDDYWSSTQGSSNSAWTWGYYDKRWYTMSKTKTSPLALIVRAF